MRGGVGLAGRAGGRRRRAARPGGAWRRAAAAAGAGAAAVCRDAGSGRRQAPPRGATCATTGGCARMCQEGRVVAASGARGRGGSVPPASGAWSLRWLRRLDRAGNCARARWLRRPPLALTPGVHVSRCGGSSQFMDAWQDRKHQKKVAAEFIGTLLFTFLAGAGVLAPCRSCRCPGRWRQREAGPRVGGRRRGFCGMMCAGRGCCWGRPVQRGGRGWPLGQRHGRQNSVSRTPVRPQRAL